MINACLIISAYPDLISLFDNVLGGPGLRYFRKVNRVTAKNGAGASTWDFQLLTSPEMEGIIPMFGASRKF